MDIFSIFFDMKVYCLSSLESPLGGDSNEYLQYTSFNIKKKITPNYPKSANYGIFPQRTQERVRSSRGKRAISVRATEVQQYINCQWNSISPLSVLGFPVKDTLYYFGFSVTPF